MRKVTLVVLLVMLAAGLGNAAELWIDRVEVGGRLLVPLRGVLEAAGATVEYYAEVKGIEITLGSTVIVMFVNNTEAHINNQPYYLDVAPRVIRGSTHIPLRFAGEALGMAVDYQGNRVVLTGGGSGTIILNIMDNTPPPPPAQPTTSGEMLPQSNDRHLVNSDLNGYSNWQMTLARNEIYARRGRPFNNSHIRAYFQSTGWYRANSSFQESWLTKTESRNAKYIADLQKATFGSPATKP